MYSLVLLLVTIATGICADDTTIRDKPYYWCPKGFFRAGNHCYYLSKKKATWRNAGFECEDIKRSHLAILDTPLEDRKLRQRLSRMKPDKYDRWIGGIYDWDQKAWIWGKTAQKMTHRSFSFQKPKTNYKWRCTVMDPYKLYRWDSRSCLQEKHFICEKPIKIRKGNFKRFRQRNEIKTRLKQKMKLKKIKEINSTL